MNPSKTPFQSRVMPWLVACFGAEIASDRGERNHRFLEESLELVQSCGCTASEAHQLVDYVFNRPVGEKTQETGGVMVTLAALCLAQGINMEIAGEVELGRVWTKVEKIREKQRNKPKHSPLPQHVHDDVLMGRLVTELRDALEQADEEYRESVDFIDAGPAPGWASTRMLLAEVNRRFPHRAIV